MAGKNKFSYHTLNCMSGLETVHPLRGFQGEPHFFSTCPPILQTNS